jgi:hypothetical protein
LERSSFEGKLIKLFFVFGPFRKSDRTGCPVKIIIFKGLTIGDFEPAASLKNFHDHRMIIARSNVNLILRMWGLGRGKCKIDVYTIRKINLKEKIQKHLQTLNILLLSIIVAEVHLSGFRRTDHNLLPITVARKARWT